MPDHTKNNARNLVLGRNATWEKVSHRLQSLDSDESETQNVLITFSGLGCCLPVQGNPDRRSAAQYEQAICLHDQPITPAMLEPILKRISRRYERVVLLLDAAFCNVESENGDTMFFREAIAVHEQAEYAPLRAADPSLLDGFESELETIDLKRKSAEKRFDQLSTKAGVEILVADECHAWETSDTNERRDHRKWQGVFSFAAQNAIQFGTDHWPWNNLGVTQRLIPHRFFPQHPVHYKPKSRRKESRSQRTAVGTST